MSVITTADEALDRARACVTQAMRELTIALDPSTWGSSDYTKEYKSTLRQNFVELSEIGDSL